MPTTSLHRRHHQLLPSFSTTEKKSSCPVSGNEQVRVAVGFFGAARFLSMSLALIPANLLAPIGGANDVFAHLLYPEAACNVDASTGENICSAPEPWDSTLVPTCMLAAEDQSGVDALYNLSAAPTRVAGSVPSWYTDNTILGVLRSRYSLWRVRALMLARQRRVGWTYTHIMMARPDMAYITPVQWQPPASAKEAFIRVPAGSSWGGVNDRFAYGDAPSMLAYATQFPTQLAFGREPLNHSSETTLCGHLAASGVRVGRTSLCMARVHLAANATPALCVSDMSMPAAEPRLRDLQARVCAAVPQHEDEVTKAADHAVVTAGANRCCSAWADAGAPNATEPATLMRYATLSVSEGGNKKLSQQHTLPIYDDTGNGCSTTGYCENGKDEFVGQCIVGGMKVAAARVHDATQDQGAGREEEHEEGNVTEGGAADTEPPLNGGVIPPMFVHFPH